MNTQQAYVKIRKWFSDPSHEPGYETTTDRCVYRYGGDPKSQVRCAVGCLIPNRIYDPSLDDPNLSGVVASSAVTYTNELSDFFQDVDVDFLESVQTLHDDMCIGRDVPKGFDRVKFINQLDQIASEHELRLVKS
jgi:hypothetical protein